MFTISQMTVEETKVRARQLNSQRHLKEQEKRIQLRKLEDVQNANRFDAILPIEFVAEFKQRVSRAHVLWKATQKDISRPLVAYEHQSVQISQE